MLGNSLDKNDENQNDIFELEIALKNAENDGNVILIKELLLKLSSAYELINHFEKAFLSLKKYETFKTDIKETDPQINRDENQLLSEVVSIKQEIEEKNKELKLLSIVARETENSILIIDPNGLIEWVNASFEKLNGLNISEFKAKYGNTIYEVSNNPEIENIIRNCIDSKKSVSYESPNVFADGKVVWESSMLTPIFNDEGRLTNLIIIDSDVTERKQNEEIIKLKNKDIMDSILYAKHIQEALLPPINELSNIFNESFMVFTDDG